MGEQELENRLTKLEQWIDDMKDDMKELKGDVKSISSKIAFATGLIVALQLAIGLYGEKIAKAIFP